MERGLKVGELARRTGLTVRTLHHYDDVGLLRPACRSQGGHRLYGAAEVRRLQAIVSLRHLGLSLDDIGARLDGNGDALASVLEARIALGRERMAREARLVARLEGILERLAVDDAVGLDDLVDTVEMTVMYEKYYTPEQLETLKARREAMGEEALDAVHRRWEELTGRVRAAMAAGVDPGSREGRSLGAEWAELSAGTVAAFTGGDPEMRASLDRLWKEEPGVGADRGMDPELLAWVGRAGKADGGR